MSLLILAESSAGLRCFSGLLLDHARHTFASHKLFHQLIEGLFVQSELLID